MEICFFVSFLFLFCWGGGGWGGVGGGGRGGVGGGVEVVGFRDTLVRSMLAACLGPAAKNMQLRLQDGRMWGRQTVQGSDNRAIKQWANTKIMDFQRKWSHAGLNRGPYGY